MSLVAPSLLMLWAAAQSPLREERFALSEPAEAAATIEAGCAGCDWGQKGREAAFLRLDLDGRYSQHLPLVRGARLASYSVCLGRLEPGEHRLSITLDARRSARAAGAVTVSSVAIRSAGAEAEPALAFAPFVYARKGTVERFSDLPVLMWSETDVTPRGRRIRYSLVFTNEDGGTPVDRLMATWGRTTDVEFVYAVELAPDGGILAESYQGREHRLVAFDGRREGRHPLLWVVTDNNMVGPRGKTRVRFAPLPRAVSLADRTREAVMDDEPWTYGASAKEARREGRVAEDARPGSGRIPDPRRFAYLEACAPAEDSTLAFSVGVAGPEGSLAWYASDAAGPRYRVSRAPHNFPNGCFQAAVALPAGATAAAIRALRLQAHTRPPAKGEKPLPEGSGHARLRRVNRLFMLDPEDEPGPNLLSWTGDVPLAVEGPPHELGVPAPP